MTYFLFPRTHKHTYYSVGFFPQTAAHPTPPPSSLHYYLSNIKTKIDNYAQWDNMKKYTNPFEYIHTAIPSQKNAVCKYKPISRSYFKMVEIIHTFHLLDGGGGGGSAAAAAALRTFHLAEGPGGFIEALVNLRRNPADIYIGMTLLDDTNEDIPGWRKSRDFLLKNKNIFLERGKDLTGNILSVANLKHCYQHYSSSMDFMTGDGGFDFSLNFNEQEKDMIPLIFAQMCYALLLQKKGGCFVLKIFDCFLPATMDILYILSAFYEKVYIVKPHTSRYANSERYVVCTGFLHTGNYSFRGAILAAFEGVVEAAAAAAAAPASVRFLNIPIPYFFMKRVEECNSVLGQNQLECIYNTMNLIENKNKSERIEFLKKTNVAKCVQWCAEHNMPADGI